MRKYSLFFVISILLIILGGCNELVTTDDLIGGKWVPKSGYKNGEPSGEPVCPPFDKGLEFKDEKTVYVVSRNKDFRYSLTEASYGMDINFFNPNGEWDFFEIIIENEDNLALIGSGASESYNCYFEREK